MYNVQNTALGETQPSFLDSLGNFIATGVSAGFNIYNKVENIKLQQAQTAQVQNLARTAVMSPQYQQQMLMQQSGGFFGGWTMPLLVGGGALALLLVLKNR